MLSSCSTELEVNAPYKETTVVYGLLNQTDSFHFIKINKTFLGQADAYAMALIRDSSEYKDITAMVEEWKSGIKTDEWPLQDTVITDKESGIFYSPNQTIYYFFEPALDHLAQYHLNISLDGGAKKVTAKTELINNISGLTGGNFAIPCSNGGGSSDKCLNFASDVDKYNEGKEFKWVSVPDGKRYQLSIKFRYKDFSDETSYIEKNIKWDLLPPLISSSLKGGEELKVTIRGEDFYKEIKKQLEPISLSNISRREFVGINFILTVIAEDFHTYLLANEPSTGIVQEKQEYWNIENGIGLFSSRYGVNSDNLRIDDKSLDELVQGKYTGTLKFCRYNPSNGVRICN